MPDVVDLNVDSHGLDRPRAIGALATRQGGPISRDQLLDLGVGRGAIDYWLRTGRLHRYLRGVYLLGHEAITAKGRVMGPVLTYAPGAVLGYRSAAAWRAILGSARSKVDIIVPGRSKSGQPGIDLHMVRSLDPRDVTTHEGVPITTVARTLLDLAEVVPLRQLERAVNQAERLRLFDGAAIEELLARSPGRRGLKPLSVVLADFRPEPTLRSEMERIFWETCKAAGLPVPTMNATVEGYEVDAHWPGTNLVVELDSREFHLNPKAFEADRERDAVLLLAGYRVVRVTYRQLTREPEKVAKRLRILLAGPRP
jgi:very-short-patch-repair endonuclease